MIIDQFPELRETRQGASCQLGFSILPVSNRDRAGGSIPIRSATSASVSPWLSRTALNRATRLKIAAKLCRLMRRPAVGGRVRRVLAADGFFLGPLLGGALWLDRWLHGFTPSARGRRRR